MEISKIEQAKRLLGFVKNKDLAVFNELNTISDELAKVNEVLDIPLSGLEQLKGEPGKDGQTPTDDEIISLIKPLIPPPEKGIDGKTPSESDLLALIRPLIPEVKDGATPTDERILGLIRPLIPIIENGLPGKDGSPDTPQQIVTKLESLEGDDRLDAEAIRNLPKPEYNPVTKKYYYGGGGGNKWNVGSSPLPGNTLTVSATAPSNAVPGDLWVDTA